jgi:hypothetical protein
MAELHKFRDDTKSKEDRVAPIKAQELDDNFKMVWLELSDSVKSFFKLTEAPGVRPKLEFRVEPPSAESVPVFENGEFSEWKQTGECD